MMSMKSKRELLTTISPRYVTATGADKARILDQFVAALWPARAGTRRAYAQTLAQRNALIARIRSRLGGRGALGSWDGQLATQGMALMSDRREAVDAMSDGFARICDELGLDGRPEVAYRPRSKARRRASQR